MKIETFYITVNDSVLNFDVFFHKAKTKIDIFLHVCVLLRTFHDCLYSSEEQHMHHFDRYISK
jgi:hypothetical protein